MVASHRRGRVLRKCPDAARSPELSEYVRYHPPMPNRRLRPNKRLRVAPQLTLGEIRELKQRSAADGRSIAQYVAVLIIEDLKRGKPVLRSSYPGRKPEEYNINLPLGLLSRAKVEARAKAEMRSLSGYVARVIVKDVGS